MLQINKNPGEAKYEKAIFAGGCFWCLQHPFEDINGVIRVTVGYTGGSTRDPGYEDVSSGTTGHLEAVEVVFDPGRVSYKELVEAFWRMIDPTDSGGQFADRGTQYRTAIFYLDEDQKKQALACRRTLQESGRFSKPVATQVLQAEKFYPAESYHQKYSEKNPARYQFYFKNSGREGFLRMYWEEKEKKGKDATTEFNNRHKNPGQEELKKRLSPLQFHVTQQCGTERPFNNEYWDNKREGIYVDIVSGEPLFSSKDKYDSGTGWPSFSRPLESRNIVERIDQSYFMVRKEVRSRQGNSHLGHVFTDGPAPSGLRYCMNSAALRFIPKEDLEKEGYAEYRKLFEK